MKFICFRTFWHIIGRQTSTRTTDLLKNLKQTKECKAIQSTKLLKAGCIFVDTSTGYIDTQFQSFFSACTTITAVDQFKANPKDSGIIISKYPSHGGLSFTSNKFQKHVASKEQSNQYTGEQAVTIRMDTLNKLFKPSWEWHKQ